LAIQTDDLQGIDQALDNLDQADEERVEPQDSPPPAAEPAAEEFVVPESTGPATGGDLPRPLMAMLNTGIAQMAAMDKVREFPEFFLRLAQTTGLRLLLLKRWTSGLQVFMEENIKLPGEAKKKRRDGRAPIPSTESDIFQAITDDASIYAGPVPVKYFPLDLTLMLGRGSRERKIVILPLPSQNHWNTFLYLDADKTTEKYLTVAEVLARFALTRMCLLNKDDRQSGGKVKAILMAEMKRRQENPGEEGGTLPGDPSPETKATAPVEEDLPVPAHPEETREPAVAAAPPKSADATGGQGNLTPEAILHHSGELPALPKAACHIMAVIEDPGTTATKLERQGTPHRQQPVLRGRSRNNHRQRGHRAAGFRGDQELDLGDGGQIGVPVAGSRYAVPEDLAPVGAVGHGGSTGGPGPGARQPRQRLHRRSDAEHRSTGPGPQPPGNVPRYSQRIRGTRTAVSHCGARSFGLRPR
jgi:hypothetical protein